MISTSRPVRLGGPLLAVVVALVLSGCAGLRPGTAAEVGEQQITSSELDEITTQFCAALEEPLAAQAQSIPHSYFRGGIAGVLALRAAAEQVAADYGVEDPDSPDYQDQLEQLRAQAGELPEAQQEAVIRIESAPFYVQAVQRAVGEQLLDGEGEDADFEAAGAEELQRWIDANDVEFDPSLNITLRDGQVAPADSSLSFAVSDSAQAGQEEAPNPAAAMELPDPQRCGR